jgi:osmotically-inducible protein OsmY
MRDFFEQTRKKCLIHTCVAFLFMLPAMTPAFSAAVAQFSNTDISAAVNTELLKDSAVTANNIDVSTNDGIVTLNGTVSTILGKDRAEEIAQAIKGVRAVINRIDVEPRVDRTDKELVQHIKDALMVDPVTESYEIDVKAEDGAVTISGNVESYAEKQISEDIAKGVKGVASVENDLAIFPYVERSDQEIEEDVKGRLENDVRVDDYLITAEVTNGAVRLAGSVGSLQEKAQAHDDAWVSGVHSVDVSDLEVKWWLRDEMRRKKEFLSRTDSEIKAAVLDAFLFDPRIIPYSPQVEVSEGTVTLTGQVANLAAKRAAGEDARNTLGVWRVKNLIKVRPEIPSREVLKERVADALLEDPALERYEFTIGAYNGWVYLGGRVDHSREKLRAEKVAGNVKGAVGVVNKIESEENWIWKPDWEIQADVEDQLEWSPYVDDRHINVTVDEGVVTLNGKVDSWTEFNEATKNAYQGGAKDVENELGVGYRYYGPSGPVYYTPPHEG